MIINWKKPKAGVLVLPCMENGIRIKTIHLLPGHNEVDNTDWEQARPAAKEHMEAGNIVEFVKEKMVSIAEDVKKVALNTENPFTVENIPYNKVIEILKENNIYRKICLLKKEETGAKQLSKGWLVDYLMEHDEDRTIVENELLATEDTQEVQTETLKLSDMDADVATDIIADTYNLETLEQWKNEISQPDLRVLILNQIEEVNKPSKSKGNK